MLGGNIRYRIRGVGTETPDVRIDAAENEGTMIYNGDENAYYAYLGDSWIEIPLSQGSLYTGLSEKVKEWSQKARERTSSPTKNGHCKLL